MALIESINSAINGFVWGVPMLVLLVGTGILMTLRTRGVQFRKFGYAMKNTIGKIFHKTAAGKGEMTPFQAMSTALAGTVGTATLLVSPPLSPWAARAPSSGCGSLPSSVCVPSTPKLPWP